MRARARTHSSKHARARALWQNFGCTVYARRSSPADRPTHTHAPAPPPAPPTHTQNFGCTICETQFVDSLNNPDGSPTQLQATRNIYEMYNIFKR